MSHDDSINQKVQATAEGQAAAPGEADTAKTTAAI